VFDGAGHALRLPIEPPWNIGNSIWEFYHFVRVAFGLGKLLATATRAFAILRFVGALYLLYLGGRIIFTTFRRTAAKPEHADLAATNQRNLFLQGLFIQITNPKALLFVSALLPQFIDPHKAVPTQLAILF
jgi:threonine/homoserine/homoserine lactone efflux protein